MKFKKSLLLFGLAAMFAMAFLAQSSSTQIRGGEKKVMTLNQSAGGSLNGAWKYNGKESDNAVEKTRNLFALHQNKSSGSPRQLSAEEAEIFWLEVLLFPPETLVLAGNGKEMTINEIFKVIVQTRTVTTDGKTRPQKQNSGIKLMVTATGKDKRLTIKTSSTGGSRLIETYELSAEAGALKVTVRILDSEGRERLNLRRVYERTTLEIVDIVSGESM